MIIEVRAKNCYAFEDDITFSMKADMRNKKFGANVHKENNFNVLKTVGIYGPNNAGKTCLIKCIRAIRNVLLNKKNGLSQIVFVLLKIHVHRIASMSASTHNNIIITHLYCVDVMRISSQVQNKKKSDNILANVPIHFIHVLPMNSKFCFITFTLFII